MDEEDADAGGYLGCVTAHLAAVVQPAYHCCLLMVKIQICPGRV